MKPKCFLRPQYILGRGSFMFKDLVHLAPISPWSHKTLPGKSKTYFFSGRKGITWFLSKNQVFKKKPGFCINLEQVPSWKEHWTPEDF